MAPTTKSVLLNPMASTFIPGLSLFNAKEPTLPDFAVRFEHPFTPKVAQTSQFDGFQPSSSHKTKYKHYLPKVDPRMPQLFKSPNPYFDSRRFKGDDPAETYYKTFPIMRAFKFHRQQRDLKYRTIGPYRKAAVWEFVGTTFEKGERSRKSRKNQQRRRREASREAKLDGTLDFSPLYEEILTTEEEEVLAAEVEKELWGDATW